MGTSEAISYYEDLIEFAGSKDEVSDYLVSEEREEDMGIGDKVGNQTFWSLLEDAVGFIRNK